MGVPPGRARSAGLCVGFVRVGVDGACLTAAAANEVPWLTVHRLGTGRGSLSRCVVPLLALFAAVHNPRGWGIRIFGAEVAATVVQVHVTPRRA